MEADSDKHWAIYRGWISNKFNVKNSPSHFLNAYKKKHNQPKTTTNNHIELTESHRELTNRKDNDSKLSNKKIASPVKKTKPKILHQQTFKKPKTAPLSHWGLIQPDMPQKESQRNLMAIKPKRTKSLQYKRSRRTQESYENPTELRQLSELERLQIQSDRNQSASQRKFKSTNYGRYKPQLMFLKPQMRISSVTDNMNKMMIYQALEQKKASIYKQINKSMYVYDKIGSFSREKKSTSIRHYQPIEYMTEFGESAQDKQHQQQCEQNQQYRRQEQQKPSGGIFRRKNNIAVLRNKLNSQFKQSMYRQKLANITIEPQICFIGHENN